jgi:Protein of unknown function (DUF3089)
MRSIPRPILFCALLAVSLVATAQVDYSSPAFWLCRPGKQDVCGVNLDSTSIAADGTLVQEPHRANPEALIDCFYVYPTISNDPGPNSDLETQPDEEQRAAIQQFARFGSRCRLFAPIYRQITMNALRGQTRPGDFELAYRDVRDAWNDYLARDNNGRGFVLIGHSQGSRLLKRLMQEEIDGKPLQARLVSAILAGNNMLIPEGKDVGAELKTIPVCRAANQMGCVISFASFRKTSPPPANTRYGKSPSSGLRVACANPAALAGGIGAAKPYFASNHRNMINDPSQPKVQPWIAAEEKIQTPYVTLPNYLTSQCIQAGDLSYLEIAIARGTGDVRREDINGDVYFRGRILSDWGLHVVDLNLVMGNLLDVVAEQSRSYLGR